MTSHLLLERTFEMPYISKHAIDRYCERKNGVSRQHAITQLQNLAEAAEYIGEEVTGAKKYSIGDMILVCDNDTILTVY
jgi:hypothetical protein